MRLPGGKPVRSAILLAFVEDWSEPWSTGSGLGIHIEGTISRDYAVLETSPPDLSRLPTELLPEAAAPGSLPHPLGVKVDGLVVLVVHRAVEELRNDVGFLEDARAPAEAAHQQWCSGSHPTGG